jgi:molybdate transport system substrate-binding protein
MTPLRRLTAIAIVLSSAIVVAACSGDADDEGVGAGGVSGDVTVFAASSLTAAFEEIRGAFQDANPDADATFNFGGSQDLRTQLEQGASADVVAFADTKQMDSAVESGAANPDYTVFAHNRLVVIVPGDNPAGIKSLQDLANSGVKVVLANEDVPVGNYSRRCLDKASADPAFDPTYKDGVLANVVSEEANVKQVATKVQLGEADAGIVYTSDVTAELAEDVAMIEVPDSLNVIADYPISLTTEPSNEQAGAAFIDFVLGKEGQSILELHGFVPVEP